VFPSQWRDMGEEVRRDDDAVHGAAVDNLPEFHGVPEDDDGGEQVHAGDAIMLPFAGSVPDFTSAVEADGALEGMMGLALVETDLSLALEAGIENPVDHEQGALDAADLAQCQGQFILARVRGEFAKNLAGGDDPRCDRRRDAQDVGPVGSMSGSLILPPTSARTLAGVAFGVKASSLF